MDERQAAREEAPGQQAAAIATIAAIATRPCFSSASRRNATSGLLAETLLSSAKSHGSHGSKSVSPAKYLPRLPIVGWSKSAVGSISVLKFWLSVETSRTQVGVLS